MNDENWKEEFKQWKPELKLFQIKLLEEGPKSQNQVCILNEMWCEWKALAVKRKINEIARSNVIPEDTCEEKEAEVSQPYG